MPQTGWGSWFPALPEEPGHGAQHRQRGLCGGVRWEPGSAWDQTQRGSAPAPFQPVAPWFIQPVQKLKVLQPAAFRAQ